jgi:phenylalanyl-tRNA synthetase alpha chain
MVGACARSGGFHREDKMMSEFVLSKVNKSIFAKQDNPVSIVRRKINDCFHNFDIIFDKKSFISSKNLEEIKLLDTTIDNSKCYFVENRNEEKSLLRPSLLLSLLDNIYSRNKFIICGDTFKKSNISKYTYPINNEMYIYCKLNDISFPSIDVRDAVDKLIKSIISPFCRYRIVDLNDDNNIINNKFEVEINIVDPISKADTWISVIDAGVITDNVNNHIGFNSNIAWLIHLNIDIIAIALFDIPDIRVLWSDDNSTIKQFKEGNIIKYKSADKSSLQERDIYINKSSGFSEPEFYALVRDVFGDRIESLKKTSDYVNPHTSKRFVYYKLGMRDLKSNHIHNSDIQQILNTLRVIAKNKLSIDIQY